MNIDDADNSEEFWTAMIEHEVLSGRGSILIPAASLTGGQSSALATRLNLTVRVEGPHYIFRRNKYNLTGDSTRH
jgi:hypothetical protein